MQNSADKNNALNYSGFRTLYKISGIIAIINSIIIVLSVVLYMAFPQPETVLGWFEQFQRNRIVGMIQFDLLYLISNVIILPITLSLWLLLKKQNQWLALMGFVLGIIAIPTLIISRPIVEFAYLSDLYASAVTETVRNQYLAAGEVMLAKFNGIGYHTHLILGVIGYLMLSVIMIKSPYFKKSTAYMGILGNGFSLGLYIPKIGIGILLFSLIFMLLWMILLSIDFIRLSKQKNI